MVRTEKDIENLPVERRIAALKLRKEIRKKKVEEKEKELEDLKKEVEQEEIEDSAYVEMNVEDLLLPETIKDPEELEQRVAEAPLEQVLVEFGYASAHTEQHVYAVTDYNVFQRLLQIEEKGYMTPEEQTFVSQIGARTAAIRAIHGRSELLAKDPTYYVERSHELVKRLTDNLYSGKVDMNAVYK